MARRPPNSPFTPLHVERLRVDAALIHGFVETFLLDTYADPWPIPPFHDDLWGLWTTPLRRAAAAAPRGHAKSTAGNHAFILANACFGNDDFAVLLSSTERLAVSHLKSIKDQCWDNKELRDAFDLEVVRDVENEFVGRVRGREFCIQAYGAEANLRGAIWRQRRPSLVVADDLENDELVMNKDRREKLWSWLMNAVLPMGSDNCRIRILGTILHSASALERLLGMSSWQSKRYRAHKDFNDFSEILWPEKFPIDRLQDERQNYIDAGNAAGYSQEYLSHPVPDEFAYFRKSDFRPLDDAHRRKPKIRYGGIDFAIGEKETSDYTCFVIGGMCDDGILVIEHVEIARLDSLKIIETWFKLWAEWKVEEWAAEEGAIRKALGPFLNREMIRSGRYMNVKLMTPTKDKQARARSFQARTRAGGVMYDTEAAWFPAYELSLTTFPRGVHDDDVDATSWLGLMLDSMAEHATPEELEEEEYQTMKHQSQLYEGRSPTIGW